MKPLPALLGALLLGGSLAGCAALPGMGSDGIAVTADGKRCIEAGGQPDLVIHLCSRAIAQGQMPDRALAMAFEKRGLAFLEKRQYGSAREDFDSAVRLVPADVNGYLGRALVNMRERRMAEAIEDLDRAVAMRPQSTTALLMRSDAHWLAGAVDKARADVEAVLSLQPRNPTALAARGSLRRQAGDLDGAEADLDLALAAKADARDALENRGHVRFLRGDFVGAAEDYQRAIDPQSDVLNRSLWLFIAQARIGDPAARDRLAKQRGAPSPRDMNALLIGMMLGNMTPEQVIAAAKDPDPLVQRERECSALFFAAEFHLWRGEKEKAAALFRRAIDTGATRVAERRAAEAELKRIDQIRIDEIAPPLKPRPSPPGEFI